MSLNIKSQEAHELTRELARLTGESLTQAVTEAVRERLERVRGNREHVRARADALLAIGQDTARRLAEPARSVDHGELLYDERGLPR
ncbi:type II toxin-antitoxin system VapB family antitoxin [Pseudonocardia hispaniensis]|uniref:Type II toxin-antitoxin system VapB family antitoxin n=1 Tax=Pseudonocardia hispaniensis TaxID=904933 RepID=A0ABW1IX22_9PSEU